MINRKAISTIFEEKCIDKKLYPTYPTFQPRTDVQFGFQKSVIVVVRGGLAVAPSATINSVSLTFCCNRH
jgi:hypothetical protein